MTVTKGGMRRIIRISKIGPEKFKQLAELLGVEDLKSITSVQVDFFLTESKPGNGRGKGSKKKV
jgi:hypothetical protein